jgi:hypothetical protein
VVVVVVVQLEVDHHLLLIHLLLELKLLLGLNLV